MATLCSDSTDRMLSLFQYLIVILVVYKLVFYVRRLVLIAPVPDNCLAP